MNRCKIATFCAFVALILLPFTLHWRPSNDRHPPADTSLRSNSDPPIARPVAKAAIQMPSSNQTTTVRGTLPYVLTSRVPFAESLRLAAEALGARTIGLMSRNALLVEADPATSHRLATDTRFESVQEHLPAHKVQSELAAQIADGAATVDVSILSLSAEDRRIVVNRLSACGGELLTGCFNERDIIRARLSSSLIMELAACGDVRWMGLFHRPQLLNDKAVAPSAMNIRAVWDNHGLTGAGQKITTSDSGIDTGDVSTMHADLRNRVKGLYFVDGCILYDKSGHGTHTAGSIVGDGTMCDGQYRGTAPEADLYALFCSKGNSTIYLPDSMADLCRPGGVDACIHSASWGATAFGDYDEDCVAMDRYAWEHPEFLPVFAAGNLGRWGGGTIDSPASAKNVLSVGATMNLPDDPTVCAVFSSQGPCRDGRIKPDVVSPGNSVTSTRSSQDGGGVVNGYRTLSGTSMACPLTAGAVALVRQWLIEHRGYSDEEGQRPTAALMKAVIMGGAKDVSVPDNICGWGRVDLAETLFPSNRSVKLIDRLPFEQGFITNIVIETTNAAPLDVQLVWIDYPAESSSSATAPKLVNDIDLTVDAYHDGGSMRHYGNGSASGDTVNNVESVRITDAPVAKYSITVFCKTILYGHTQGGAAALYIRGAFNPGTDATPDWYRTETIGDITWSYTVANGVAMVGGGHVRAVPTSTSGAITIPATLGGFPVAVIDDYAFADCLNLTAVTIPPGVTSIAPFAFSGCVGLETVEIPSSVTNVSALAFRDCAAVRAVTLPPCVTHLADAFPSAFSCITSVVLAAGIKDIASSAFKDCVGLKSVMIPPSVTFLGTAAFSGCTQLSKIAIPSGVTHIAESTFSGCAALTTVTIPNSVTNIGTKAFCNCAELTSVTIPSGVTILGTAAFSGCTQLSKIDIPSGVTHIANSTFSGCAALTTVTIPNSVTNIDKNAFSGCSVLKDVTIPSSILYIGPSAFNGCSALAAVTLPDGVTRIGESAFSDCSKLTSVTIPSGVRYVENEVFSNCTSMRSVVIQPGIERIGSCAFADCTNLKTVSIPASVTRICAGAFANCTGLGRGVVVSCGCVLRVTTNPRTVVLPAGTRLIVDGAFSGCSNLKTLTLSSELASISESAFSDCTALTSVSIPAGVTNIGNYAFEYCSSLKSVTIPSSVTTIGWNAFFCSALPSVEIPSSVRFLGGEAFRLNRALTNIVFHGDAPTIIRRNVFMQAPVFGDVPSTCRAIVHEGTSGWDDDGDGRWQGLELAYLSDLGAGLTACDYRDGRFVISGSGELTDTSALADKAITHLIIGAGVTGIGANVFANRRDLREVMIGADCKIIGACAFNNCYNITNLTCAAGVTIGDCAFLHCNSLMSLSFGEGVTFGETPFTLMTGICMKDDIPEIYTIPSVVIMGNSQVLQGSTDLQNWDDITDVSQKANYNFFKIVIRPCDYCSGN